MAIRAGELNRRIVLQQKTTARDAHGEEIPAWSKVSEVWAKVSPVLAKERNAAPQVMPVEQATILIRWRDGVHPAMRVLHRGKQWQIDGIAEVGSREGLQLSVQIVTAG